MDPHNEMEDEVTTTTEEAETVGSLWSTFFFGDNHFDQPKLVKTCKKQWRVIANLQYFAWANYKKVVSATVGITKCSLCSAYIIVFMMCRTQIFVIIYK